MDGINTTFDTDDLSPQPRLPLQPPRPPREKSKRPQLSCNPCRARKVKCDRIQPCTACSLHQIAELCEFDLSEAERQPILQAEALKDRDKTIANLRNEMAILRGEPIKAEPSDDNIFARSGQKIKLPPKVTKKPSPPPPPPTQAFSGDSSDNIYFGSPGMTSVVEEFAHLAFDRRPSNLTHAVPRATDIFAFQLATSHPFPTLWSAKDDTSSLVKLLPPEQDLFFYLDAFQRRAQFCSFPHVPDQCTNIEVRRFLDNLEHNAALYPDMLALLFATLAQGLQDGVYDKFGGKWVAGSVEQESKKGEVYIAAAYQCLRLASFMSRPTLLVIEALVMMGPYLTNSGKFLDASALFGCTVRLAQSIGRKSRASLDIVNFLLTYIVHRDPSQLNPPAPPKEMNIRRNLWWWMIHMDQQYSMALGRPMAISSMGDCRPPEPIVQDPLVQSLSNYLVQFSILGRQILCSGYLNNDQIDRFSDDLLALQKTLPALISLDLSWLDKDKILPGWPLDAQAGVLHAKTHNFLILLNRKRIENVRRNSEGPNINFSPVYPSVDANNVPRGRGRVLMSCRALLVAFQFFSTRVRAAMICWTMGQMAFNAAMILLLSMLETGDTQDLGAVQHTYITFLEMNKLGIHKLAGAAVERLGLLMKEFRAGDPANETVMGQQGMMLLEDPGLQGSMPESFAPLSFHMAGGADTPGMRREGSDIGYRTEVSQLARKKAQRKSGLGREGKGKSEKKTVGKSAQRPWTDRRFSDGATPKQSRKRKANRVTPVLSLATILPGQHNFSVTPQPAIKPEDELFSPIQSTYQGFHPINSPVQQHQQHQQQQQPSQQQQQQQQPQQQQQRNHFETTPRPQPFPQPHQHVANLAHNNQPHAASDPGDHTFAFSNQTTPGSACNYFDETLGHHFAGEFDLHTPYSAPPFSLPDDPSSSYTQHF